MDNKKIIELIEVIKGMSATEIVEFIDALQQEFKIDSSMLAVSSGGGDSSSGEAKSESASSTFRVVMNNVAADKSTEAIKSIKLLLNIGLGEAKAMVDKAKSGEEVIIKSGMTEADAKELASKISASGGQTSVTADS